MEKLPEFTVIIPAAGSSTRMGSDKLFLNLAGKPVIQRTIETFQKYPECKKIILVTSRINIPKMEKLVSNCSISRIQAIIEGGETRQDSVRNGLKLVTTEITAVHDGARPLVSQEAIRNLHTGIIDSDGCIPVLPVKDTIKVLSPEGYVESTPSRKNLVLVQTPQFFKTNLLRKAYKRISKAEVPVTDDSSLMELAGYRIKALPGSPFNLKITTPEDIITAEGFLKAYSS